MSNTKIDMAKVTQMLDAGWFVRLYKNSMGSYEARAFHKNAKVMERARVALIKGMSENRKFLESVGMSAAEAVEAQDYDDDGWLMTDDFTPEQAMTRIACKVHGEII